MLKFFTILTVIVSATKMSHTKTTDAKLAALQLNQEPDVVEPAPEPI